MPRLKDGTIVRARYTKLDLRELSAVDRPAQPGALATILKRDDSRDGEGYADLQLVAKYICQDDGAHTFAEVLAENKFSEQIWPFTDALTQSIRSIIGDKRLSGDEREAKVIESVASFLSKIREIAPEVAKQLQGLVKKKDGPMPKSIEELTAELAKANGQIEQLTARAEKAEGERDAAKAAQADAEKARDEAKKALSEATDDVVKVGDREVKKSVVGTEQFEAFKALADERDLARLEKRADTEFGHVVGKAEDKAKVLKAIEGIADEETRKAGLAILESAEKMAKGAFSMLGGRGPSESEDQETAKRDFETKVEEIAKRDKCNHTEAMSKARRENPELFKRMQGGQPGAAN